MSSSSNFKLSAFLSKGFVCKHSLKPWAIGVGLSACICLKMEFALKIMKLVYCICNFAFKVKAFQRCENCKTNPFHREHSHASHIFSQQSSTCAADRSLSRVPTVRSARLCLSSISMERERAPAWLAVPRTSRRAWCPWRSMDCVTRAAGSMQLLTFLG